MDKKALSPPLKYQRRTPLFCKNLLKNCNNSVCGKKFWRLGIYTFLILASLPTLGVMILAYWQTAVSLGDIDKAAESASQIHLPGILDSQRTLVNIEALRKAVEVAYTTSDSTQRRHSVVDAMALATESGFEPDSHFVESSSTVLVLIRGLAKAKAKSDVALDSLHKAENQLMASLARLEQVALVTHGDLPFPAIDNEFMQGFGISHSGRSAWQVEEGQEQLKDVFAYCQQIVHSNKPNTTPGSYIAKRCDDTSVAWVEMMNNFAAQRKANEEAKSIWQNLDALLHALSNLVSSQEAELTYRAMEYIRQEVENTRIIFYVTCGVTFLMFLAFVWALHRYVLAPLALASRCLHSIRDGGELLPMPQVRVGEIQDTLNMLPVIRGHLEDLAVRSCVLEREKDTFRNLSYIDGLTNVGNRRAFDTQFNDVGKELSVALLMLDVDMFKMYNDCYGHKAGDDVLINVAKGMQNSLLRSSDQVFRYGGEEFCVLLIGASNASAYGVAERIRENMLAMQIPHATSPVSPYVTISIGVAVREVNSPLKNEELLDFADKALYRAKNSGRNQVCLHTQWR